MSLDSDASSIGGVYSAQTGLARSNLMAFNIAARFHEPMDRQNYITWRKQFLDVLAAHDLSDHVTGVMSMEYCHWSKKDKLVLSWIIATIHSSIQSYILAVKQLEKDGSCWKSTFHHSPSFIFAI